MKKEELQILKEKGILYKGFAKKPKNLLEHFNLFNQSLNPTIYITQAYAKNQKIKTDKKGFYTKIDGIRIPVYIVDSKGKMKK